MISSEKAKGGLDKQKTLKKLQVKTVHSSGLGNYNYLRYLEEKRNDCAQD